MEAARSYGLSRLTQARVGSYRFSPTACTQKASLQCVLFEKDAAAVFKALPTFPVLTESFSNIPEPHKGRQRSEGLPTLAVS